MGEMDKIIGQLIWTGLSLYILSMFISMFDTRTGYFIKQTSYLFAFSVLFVVASSIHTTFVDLVEALNNISESKVFSLFSKSE